MILLSPAASDDETLKAVCTWVGLLAQEQYETAQGLLASEGVEQLWTPASVKELLASYGPIDNGIGYFPSKVTAVETAKVYDLKPRPQVQRCAKPHQHTDVVGYVEFDLPIRDMVRPYRAVLAAQNGYGRMVLRARRHSCSINCDPKQHSSYRPTPPLGR